MNGDNSPNVPPGEQPPGESRPQQPPAGQSPPPPPPPPMSPRPVRPRSYLIPLALSIGCLPWLILGLVVLVAAFRGAGEQHGEHVALIRINGLITAGSSGSSLFDGNVSGSEDVVEQLEKARESSSVKAVVIRINSPGGSPAGSEEIYRAIRRVRNSGKVVYASMGDVAASGGYYIAAPCNKIYSDASTITGSIGVIFETADLSSLFKKIGMNPETIKSGKYKDIGSPNRPLTSEERKLLQGIVDDTYATFVRAVSDGRKMSIVDVKKIADGRVFTGAQARKIKLVDEIGGQYETVRAAAVAGGIKGKPKVVEYRKAGWLESVLGGSGARAADEALRRELADRLLRGGQSQTLPR